MSETYSDKIPTTQPELTLATATCSNRNSCAAEVRSGNKRCALCELQGARAAHGTWRGAAVPRRWPPVPRRRAPVAGGWAPVTRRRPAVARRRPPIPRGRSPVPRRRAPVRPRLAAARPARPARLLVRDDAARGVEHGRARLTSRGEERSAGGAWGQRPAGEVRQLWDHPRGRADELVDLIWGEGLEFGAGEEESDADGVSTLQQGDHAVALPA